MMRTCDFGGSGHPMAGRDGAVPRSEGPGLPVETWMIGPWRDLPEHAGLDTIDPVTARLHGRPHSANGLADAAVSTVAGWS